MTTRSTPDATVRVLDFAQAAYDQLGQALVALGADGLALEATQQRRWGGGKTPVCATVTASGDTVVHSPAAGKAVRLWWVLAVNDPDEATSPLIKVSIGALECYRGYAIAHWEPFEGAAGEDVVVNLSGAASVAVTLHLEEFTP